MTTATTSTHHVQARDRHLSENEAECIKHNIIVHVDSINADQSVAFCSVEQRHAGLFRRTLTVHELIWRAEQALAPLIGAGIVPLVTVRHKSLLNAGAAQPHQGQRSLMDRISELLKWLGLPMWREGFGTVALVNDPFGWRRAMTASNRKCSKATN